MFAVSGLSLGDALVPRCFNGNQSLAVSNRAMTSHARR